MTSRAMRRTRSSKSVTSLCDGLRAVLIERRGHLCREVIGLTAFDLPPLPHLDDLAITEQRDRRRRRAVAHQILACTLRRFAIVACEDRDHLVRNVAVLGSHRDRRADIAGSATADRV